MKQIFALVILALTLAAPAALSAEAKAMLSWQPPTDRVDGTPLSIDEVAGYRLYHTVDGPVDPGGDFTTLEAFQKAHEFTLTLAPRAEPYTVNFAISVVDLDGLESAVSETVSKSFEVNSTAAPNAPTSLTVTVTCGEGCTIEVLQTE